MELRQYARILLRWWWLLTLATALAGGASWYVSNLQPRIYQASATLLVNQAQGAGGLDYNSLLLSERLTRTYAQLITKPPVLQAAVAKVGLPYDPVWLEDAVQVRVIRDTQLLEITAEHEDPALARDLANTVAETFIAQRLAEQLGQQTASREALRRQIAELDREIEETSGALERAKAAEPPQPEEVARLQGLLAQQQSNYSQLLRSEADLALAEARTASSLRLAVPAELPELPVRPKLLQNTALAAVVGLLIALGAAFLVEYLDDTVKGEEDVRAVSGLPILAVIARVGGRKTAAPRRLDEKAARSPLGEAYRVLRANVDFAWAGDPGKVIMVTSAGAGEGKSTTLANLAVTLAEAKRRVVVLDADLRRPSAHKAFGLDLEASAKGLTNLLAQRGGVGERDWLDRWTEWSATAGGSSTGEYLRLTDVPNLLVLPCGPIPPNPSELLGSPRFGEILEALREFADVVLVDAPPVLAVVDPAVLAPRVDGVILVAEAGSTKVGALARTVELLGRTSARLLGVVLNKVGERSVDYQYYYRSYRYGEPHSNGTAKDLEPVGR